MKRKILIGVIALFTLCSTAYAAVAINGLYKGRPIVSVLVNGQKVVSAVPGQIIDNSTMLPLRAIAESLGADVKWDQSRYQASVTIPQEPVQPVQTGLSLEQLNEVGKSVGLVYAFDSNKQLLGTGSGFVVNGTFVTNWHVAEKATSLEIWFGNQSKTVNVSDAAFNNITNDLIGFTLTGYPSVKLNTEQPNKGDKVYALGYPHRKFQLSEGNILFFTVVGNITHSATTDNGSSGGILINSAGEVIGITNAGMDGTEYNNAIPAQTLQDELNKL